MLNAITVSAIDESKPQIPIIDIVAPPIPIIANVTPAIPATRLQFKCFILLAISLPSFVTSVGSNPWYPVFMIFVWYRFKRDQP